MDTGGQRWTQLDTGHYKTKEVLENPLSIQCAVLLTPSLQVNEQGVNTIA